MGFGVNLRSLRCAQARQALVLSVSGVGCMIAALWGLLIGVDRVHSRPVVETALAAPLRGYAVPLSRRRESVLARVVPVSSRISSAKEKSDFISGFPGEVVCLVARIRCCWSRGGDCSLCKVPGSISSISLGVRGLFDSEEGLGGTLEWAGEGECLGGAFACGSDIADGGI